MCSVKVAILTAVLLQVNIFVLYPHPYDRVFPRPFTHGGICPPIWGGQVQGDKALMGGTHEGGHRPYGGT